MDDIIKIKSCFSSSFKSIVSSLVSHRKTPRTECMVLEAEITFGIGGSGERKKNKQKFLWFRDLVVCMTIYQKRKIAIDMK